MTLFYWLGVEGISYYGSWSNSKDYQQILRKRSSCGEFFPFILFSLNSAIQRTTFAIDIKFEKQNIQI